MCKCILFWERQLHSCHQVYSGVKMSKGFNLEGNKSTPCFKNPCAHNIPDHFPTHLKSLYSTPEIDTILQTSCTPMKSNNLKISRSYHLSSPHCPGVWAPPVGKQDLLSTGAIRTTHAFLITNTTTAKDVRKNH